MCNFPLLQTWYYKNRLALRSQMALGASEARSSLMTMAMAHEEPLGLWCQTVSFWGIVFIKQYPSLNLSLDAKIHHWDKNVTTVLVWYLFCSCVSSAAVLFANNNNNNNNHQEHITSNPGPDHPLAGCFTTRLWWPLSDGFIDWLIDPSIHSAKSTISYKQDHRIGSQKIYVGLIKASFLKAVLSWETL